MTSRDRLVIMVALAVAAVIAAWMFVIQPKRNQSSKLGSEVSSTQSQLTSIQSKVSQEKQASRSFTGDYAELVQLGQAVPPDDQIPSLIYQIQSAAGAASVQFRGLQLSTGSTSGTSASSSSSSSSSSSNSNSQLPPGATIGPAGFPTEQFTFTFQGNFFSLSNFFDRLQRFVIPTSNELSISGRLMTLNAINLSAATPQGFPQITATVSATTYLLPASQGLMNGATPSGPAASTQPASSPSASTPAAPAAITAPLK